MIFAASLWQANDAAAQSIDPAFAGEYTITNLGAVPGLPEGYVALIFKPGDDNTILVGGYPENEASAIYSVTVVRGAGEHITGFTGTATKFANAPGSTPTSGLDGGLDYGPENVLFYTSYDDNQCGQIKPGSSSPDRMVALTPLGVASSVGGLGFVPTGFGGAGQIKFTSYSTGKWYDATVTADGAGTFDITGVTEAATLPDNGPEGFVYVKAGHPLITVDSLIMAELSEDKIVVYEIDSNGNPVASTRRVLADMNGTGPFSCAFDPVTGDLLIPNLTISRIEGFNAPCGVCGAGGATMLPLMLMGTQLMRRRKIERIKPPQHA